MQLQLAVEQLQEELLIAPPQANVIDEESLDEGNSSDSGESSGSIGSEFSQRLLDDINEY